MGKKNKAKGPKGRAAAKQKAKKGSGSGGGSAGFSQYSSPMSRFSKQMLDDEGLRLLPSMIAPSSC
jgi:hypothetical protein